MAAVLAALSACSHKVHTPVTPATEIYSSYSEKIPGKWLAAVEPGNGTRVVQVTGHYCSAHDFPMDANAAYVESVKRTLQNVFESVELVSSTSRAEEDAAAVRAAGALGLVRVHRVQFEPRVAFLPGFWNGTADASVDLSARLSVEGTDGRLYGGSVDGDGRATAEGMCDDGAAALAQATSKALLDFMEDMGERLSNETRLRDAAAAAAAQTSGIGAAGGAAAPGS